MRNRSGLIVVLVLVVGAVAASLWAIQLRAARRPPTIVLVSIDTLRADHIGAYGSPDGLTPRIDALAATGMVFENCWTTVPLTVPAHVSLMTGLAPPLHGLRTNTSGRTIPPAGARPYVTTAEVLRSEGWTTGAFISASVLRKDRTGLDAGFDVYDEVDATVEGALHETERRGPDTVNAALEWAGKHAGDRLFLWVHLFDPHAPYDAPTPWGAGSSNVATAEGYAGEVAYADHALGLLLDGLAERGIEDPVVILVSDHGEGLGEHGERTHGHLLHEATLHVPLVVHAPGRLAGGRRDAAPASLVDVARTIVSFAGLAQPESMGGIDLLTRSAPEKRAVYAESLYGYEGARWAQLFAARIGDDKVIDHGRRAEWYGLDADPAELAPEGVHEDDPADNVRQRLLHEIIRPTARREPLGRPAAAPDELQGGSYWSTGAGSTTVLSAEENADLPSPYDRMEVLADLDAARSLLEAGRADAAVARLKQVIRDDPGNPQAHRWLARALQQSNRQADAAAAYRTAFELGWAHPDCLAKGLQASIGAVQAGSTTELEAGLAFLTAARGQNVPQNGKSFVCEAVLLFLDGRRDEAETALGHAREEPRTAELDALIRGAEGLLGE